MKANFVLATIFVILSLIFVSSATIHGEEKLVKAEFGNGIEANGANLISVVFAIVATIVATIM